MRRYEDPVEVRRGSVDTTHGTADERLGASADTVLDDDRAPSQFLWHGRLWKVRAVLAHWVETGPWWGSPGVRAVIGAPEGDEEQAPAVPRPLGDLLTERELWRVEAGRGRAVGADGEPDTGGVFDLAFDWADGRWQLVGCMD